MTNFIHRKTSNKKLWILVVFRKASCTIILHIFYHDMQIADITMHWILFCSALFGPIIIRGKNCISVQKQMQSLSIYCSIFCQREDWKWYNSQYSITKISTNKPIPILIQCFCNWLISILYFIKYPSYISKYSLKWITLPYSSNNYYRLWKVWN